MIKLSGSAPCEGVTFESDMWIPLKVTWLPRPPGRPLYLRLTGDAGGEVEIKVDAVSGALVQMVVVKEPPRGAEATDYGLARSVENSVPTLDLEPWRDSAEGERSVGEAGHVRHVKTDMRCWRQSGRIGIVLSTQKIRHTYECDDVRVSTSAEACLTTISCPLRETT